MSGSQHKPESFTKGFLKFTGLSALAGLLGVALLAPTALVSGIAASAGITIFENLPDYIKPVNASQSSTLYATKDGQPVEVAQFYHENRISIDYNEMSPNIRNAVVATEDPRFFEHGGVDWLSLVRATLTNAASLGNGPGGSTITMQYVKNSLVEAANLAGDKEGVIAATQGGFAGIDRKLREIRLAIALEGGATKQEILAGYLNLSFFGNQINGIEAASNYYFGKTAKELNIQEAALLAGMLKSPNDYKPDEAENLDRAKSRRDYVINNMEAEGYITGQQAREAKNSPIVTKLTHTPSGCEGTETAAFFCDFVVWTIRNNSEFGPTPEDRENLLRRGGLEIYSTMDLDIQEAAHKASFTWAPPTDPSQIGSASTSVEVGTGRILAIAQNRYYDQTQSTEPGRTSVNYSTDREYGGSSGFQTGSTYKVFTLAQWLTNGFRLGDHVDGRVKEWQASEFSARCGGIGGTWAPKNIVKEPEDLNIVQATAMSVNTAYVSMASQLDLCDIRDTAMRFGVHRADGTELQYIPASILGVNEIAPLTMAAAMAGIANKGVYCSPVAIDKVIVRNTKAELRVPTTNCSVAVSPEVAAGMTYAMQRVISGGTGGASATGDGTPLAGKTGTTDSGVHTWMTGFSSKVGTATWVGNVVGTKSLGSLRLNNKAANTVRHDIWRTIMQAANKKYPGEAFDAPPADMIGTTMITIPQVAGSAPDAAVELIKASDLNAKVAVSPVTSSFPKGSVAYTKPGVGSTAARGSQIKIFVSAGGAETVPNVAGMSVTNAKATLLAAGFSAVSEPQPSQSQFFVKSPTIPAGKVVGTDPAAGSAADMAGAILLIISTGP
ncbi:transglycosylase domain-containing protein [Rhodoluna lacicola]|uniref:transglycosylase domain-containing protein n=1 Tax=Rhodoluna lacicola TaxID=529884 RepID=UPI00223257B5|nr:transglycosylase domain-containing protein [Rhodoluna lacicola]BDS50041.1 carboxypeptidase [Rhodoluna lacicola]